MHCIKFSLVQFFSDATYQKMLMQLAQCEFAIGKTQTVFEMNELETENYEKIYREIGKCKLEEIALENIFWEVGSIGFLDRLI